MYSFKAKRDHERNKINESVYEFESEKHGRNFREGNEGLERGMGKMT